MRRLCHSCPMTTSQDEIELTIYGRCACSIVTSANLNCPRAPSGRLTRGRSSADGSSQRAGIYLSQIPRSITPATFSWPGKFAARPRRTASPAPLRALGRAAARPPLRLLKFVGAMHREDHSRLLTGYVRYSPHRLSLPPPRGCAEPGFRCAQVKREGHAA